MTEKQDMKIIGKRLLDDIVVLAQDASTLIAELCMRIYNSIETAYGKHKAKSAAD
ncbi:MAG: hypothetical protein OSJ83_01115 [Clostridia bacterium]|nr:hypothetical protein [Clostridia bacterium]